MTSNSFGQNAGSVRDFTCPASIQVAEQPQSFDWKPEPANSSHKFKTAKVYNGHPGGEKDELAPDELTRPGEKIKAAWKLNDYRDMNIYARCFYHDTAATVSRDIPQRFTVCSLVVQMNAKHQIVGNSTFQCK